MNFAGPQFNLPNVWINPLIAPPMGAPIHLQRGPAVRQPMGQRMGPPPGPPMQMPMEWAVGLERGMPIGQPLGPRPSTAPPMGPPMHRPAGWPMALPMGPPMRPPLESPMDVIMEWEHPRGPSTGSSTEISTAETIGSPIDLQMDLAMTPPTQSPMGPPIGLPLGYGIYVEYQPQMGPPQILLLPQYIESFNKHFNGLLRQPPNAKIPARIFISRYKKDKVQFVGVQRHQTQYYQYDPNEIELYPCEFNDAYETPKYSSNYCKSVDAMVVNVFDHTTNSVFVFKYEEENEKFVFHVCRCCPKETEESHLTPKYVELSGDWREVIHTHNSFTGLMEKYCIDESGGFQQVEYPELEFNSSLDVNIELILIYPTKFIVIKKKEDGTIEKNSVFDKKYHLLPPNPVRTLKWRKRAEVIAVNFSEHARWDKMMYLTTLEHSAMVHQNLKSWMQENPSRCLGYDEERMNVATLQ